MARATRVDLAGEWYHVVNRGAERRPIFRSRRCYEKFLELLSNLPVRFGVRIHGYVLMGNHYHLQIRTQEANLSKTVHWLNVSYSVWFNRKYGRVGPLFQGRFKAIMHEASQALRINRYIHLNPVRVVALGGHEASIGPGLEITPQLARQRVEALEQHPWSSYVFFAGIKPTPEWLSTEEILEHFGPGPRSKRRQAFRKQLEAAAALGKWETDWKSQIKYTVFLGSAQFVTRMRKLLKGDRDQQTGLRRASAETLSWPDIVRSVSEVWGKPWEELLHRRGSGARETALYLGRIHGRLSLKELAVLAGGLHHNAMSIAIRRLIERLKRDPDLQRRLSALQKILTQT
jgi:REP-associated tyrosine transposase